MRKNQTAGAGKGTGNKLLERLASFRLFGDGRNENRETVVEAGRDTQQDVKSKRPIVRRILYAVLSLILATILWGYVLMTQNPDREKTFTGVTLTFESGAEADLGARNLMIYDDVNEIMQDVAVTVSAPLTEISKIKPGDITATVSVAKVKSAGVYSLEIKAVSTVGSVVSIEPDHIDLTVDDVFSRNVSVSYSFVGELPEAYWHDEPSLSVSNIVLEGAKTDLERAAGSVCYIDLEGLTSSINRSIPLVVYDGEGNEIPSSSFTRLIPAVTVSMTVLPHKHVNIEYEIADRDQLSDLYEIQSETLSVSSIDVAADPDTLASIETLVASPVYIGGTADEAGEYKYPLTITNMPSSAMIIDGTDKGNIQLSVVITDKYVTETFTDVPIEVLNKADGFAYTCESDTTDMTVSGPAKLLVNFVSSDVIVCINMQRRGTGEYEMRIEYKPAEGASFGDLEIGFPSETIHVSVVPTHTLG